MVSVELKDVLFANLRIHQDSLGKPDPISKQILASLPHAAVRYLGKLRLQAMLQIVNRHEVRKAALKGKGCRRRKNEQIDSQFLEETCGALIDARLNEIDSVDSKPRLNILRLSRDHWIHRFDTPALSGKLVP